MAEDDDKWWQALADAGGSADGRMQREHEALRRAAQAIEDKPVDELAERRLLQRLEKEGLLARKHARQRLGLRYLGRAAVMLLCVGLLLEWFLILPPDSQPLAESALQYAETAPAGAPVARKAPAPQMLRSGQKFADQAGAMRQKPRMAEDARAEEQALDLAGAPRSDAVVPETLQVRVDALAAARAALASMVEDPAIHRRNAAPDPPADDWLLECTTSPACERLNAWLQEQDAERRFQPGRRLLLQLRAR